MPADVHACWYKNMGRTMANGQAAGAAGNNALNQNKGDAVKGEPVYLSSGEYLYTKQDVVIPSKGMPFQITRTYKSQLLYNGSFGYGWDLNYHQRIVPQADGSAVWMDGVGRRYVFTYYYGTNYNPPAELYEALNLNADGTWTMTSKDKTVRTFNVNGCLSKITDRNGNSMTFAYTSQKQPINGISPFAHNKSAAVVLLSYDYLLTSVTDTDGRVTNLAYTTDGRLSDITDFAGRVVHYTYSPEGDLLSVKYPVTADGRPTTINYKYTNHNLETIIDQKSQSYLQTFYSAQDKVDSQQFGSSTMYFTYDTVNKKTESRDGLGNREVYTFNAQGLPAKKEVFTRGLRSGEPVSYVTTYTYNWHTELLQTTYPDGSSVVNTYDTQGNVLTITRKPPSGSTAPNLVTTFTYESNYNFVKTVVDPNGKKTTYYYDYEEATLGDLNGDGVTNQAKGNLVKITYPTAGTQTPEAKFVYNAAGQVTKTIDSNGIVTQYTYDAATGYLTAAAKDPAGLNVVTAMTYDNLGNVKTITDPLGYITSLDYDTHNNLIKTTAPSPMSYITNYTYDANDNLVQVDRETRDTGNPQQTTAYTYDILDRVASITDELGNTVFFTYDANGNRASVTDAENHVSSSVYDERNLLWKTTDALNQVTEYAYDLNGNLKEIKDAKGNKTSYAYDGLSRLSATTYADVTSESYTYDSNSNLLTKKDPKGQTTTYTYDALNRLTQKAYPSGSVTYAYDTGSRLTGVTDANGSIAYVFDNLNRVTQVTYPGSRVVQYTYDKDSNRSKLTYPDNSYITYTYDQLNRLTVVNDQAGTSIAGYTYDALSRRNKAALANGVEAAYTYDYANRLLQLMNRQTAAPTVKVSQFDYTYDKVGNRKTMATLSGTHTYTYDTGYQLKTAAYPSGYFAPNTTFNYDGVGNRSSVVTGSTTTYTANALNQYSNVGGTTYTNDANGNLAGDGVWTYTYDYDNRLTQATKTGTTAAYKYDPFGRRIEKNVNNGTVTKFVYDGDQVIAEYDGTGALQAKYVYGAGIDEVLTMWRGNQTYYYHYDGLGSVANIPTRRKW